MQFAAARPNFWPFPVSPTAPRSAAAIHGMPPPSCYLLPCSPVAVPVTLRPVAPCCRPVIQSVFEDTQKSAAALHKWASQAVNRCVIAASSLSSCRKLPVQPVLKPASNGQSKKK